MQVPATLVHHLSHGAIPTTCVRNRFPCHRWNMAERPCLVRTRRQQCRRSFRQSVVGCHHTVLLHHRLVSYAVFLPHNTMCKCGTSYQQVSVRRVHVLYSNGWRYCQTCLCRVVPSFQFFWQSLKASLKPSQSEINLSIGLKTNF